MFKYVKVRKVKNPQRAKGNNAGIDLYIPDEILPLVLEPGDSVLVPSGIHIKVDRNKAFVLFNKSGVSAKKNLDLGACVIDEDYQGELFFNLHNIGNRDVRIYPGEKIVQGLLLNVSYDIPENIFEGVEYFSEKEIKEKLKKLYPEESIRGTGSLGSTNKKKEK